ncbi:endonuclease III [Helicobacter mustelae]|nr:endonuclease III [Helicobacter mustelae]
MHRAGKLRKTQKAEIIKERFLRHYPAPKTELKYQNIYELLVAVMLSAQCTDKRVNIVTPALFSRYPTPKQLADANLEELKEYIRSVSFFNNKAKNLIAMANQLLESFGGEIPRDRELLKMLPGVGQKTANVVLIEYCEANLMAVDTHVFRTSHRLGLSKSKSALQTEVDLCKLFKTDLDKLHQAFVLFGRYVCKALRPACESCFVNEFCITKKNFKPS